MDIQKIHELATVNSRKLAIDELIEKVREIPQILTYTPKNALEFELLIEIITFHSVRLSDAQLHREAMQLIDRGLEIFESQSKEPNILFEESWYVNLLFGRAVSNFNLKKYSSARRDLKALKDHFPNEFKYQKWLDTTKTWLLSRIMNYCLLLIGLLYIANHLFEDFSSKFLGLSAILASVLFSIALTLFILIEVIKWKHRKLESKSL